MSQITNKLAHLTRFSVMSIPQMPAGQRAPVLSVWVRTGFSLHLGEGLLNGLGRLTAPGPDGPGIRPVVMNQLAFSHFQTIPAQRRGFQSWIDVVRVVVLAMATEAQ